MKTAYYIGEGKKDPVLILEKKRVWAKVKLLPNRLRPNCWEIWEVPIEDLIYTNDFTVKSNSILGDVYILNKNSNNK
jgi:hypothetical protein